MSDLIPPKENRFVVGCAKLALPPFLRWQKLDVNPTASCIDSMKQLHGQQTVLLLNHSDRYDPVVAFTLSKLAGEDFYYLSARELFDDRLSGWFLQNCGAYSVIRGFPEDKASKELTISLMTQGTRKLIEFPEGDVTGNDDHIFPLKKDGLLNMLEAQCRLYDERPGHSIYLLPICTLYELDAGAMSAVESRMSDLERQLGIVANARDAIELRMKNLLAGLISRLRQRYDIRRALPDSIDSALREIARIVILKIAQSFGIVLDATRSEADLLYDVRSKLRKRPNAYRADLDRLQQLLITSNTLEQPFTGEVAWRLVDRIENLLTGRFTIKGWRTAWLDSGAPIDLRAFIKNKPTAPQDAVDELESRVSTVMEETLERLRRQHHTSAFVRR